MKASRSTSEGFLEVPMDSFVRSTDFPVRTVDFPRSLCGLFRSALRTLLNGLELLPFELVVALSLVAGLLRPEGLAVASREFLVGSDFAMAAFPSL